jgi:probable H4MPT-linked C1 transfer pathway protein
MAGVIADVVGRLGAGAMERVGAGAMERVGAGDARVAMTTTAELVDAFASKRDGVLHVLGAAAAGLPGCSVRVMTTDGALIALDEARAAPLRCAAANWMASALLVARSVPDAILIDCGGTTTDLIPIAGGAVVARGRTDVERLLAGELVYTGALRTNVAAVLSHAPVGGRPCPVASELFAVAADAHLLLGNLSPERCTCTFPDGRGTSAGEVASCAPTPSSWARAISRRSPPRSKRPRSPRSPPHSAKSPRECPPPPR